MTYFKNDVTEDDLTAEELIKRIYDKPDWVSHVNDRLSYKEYIVPEDENESLDLLISLYTNKKSKRVNYAGNKLKKVFNCLPPVEKRKVGIALLNGNKTDSEWVCKNLNSYKHPYKPEWTINWHPCYARFVEDCWNKYHGYYCGMLMVEFLEEETVRKHFDELVNYKYYFYLSRRFLNRDWFTLDVEKLKSSTHINAYLSVMSKTKKGIQAEEAKQLLYNWVAVVTIYSTKQIIGNILKFKNLFWDDRYYEHQVINIWGMDTALYYLLKMGHKKVVKDFLDWNEAVSNLYNEENELVFDEPRYKDKFCQAIVDLFPKEYRYMLYLNHKNYSFMESPGQPYTKPKLVWWTHAETTIPALYFNELTEENIRIYERNAISKRDYIKSIQSNKEINKLMEQLDLSMVSVEENERRKELEDYGHYLRNNK